MSEQASEPVRRPRINPFVFPSETTLRFGLLVVFVLCGSAGFYGDFRGTQIQASEACAAQLIPKLLKLTSSMAGNDIHAVFAEVKVHFRSLAGCAALLRPQALWHLGGMGLVIVVAAIIYYLYPAWTLKIGRLEPIGPSEFPELVQELSSLTQTARLRHPVVFVWNPVAGGLPVVFGRYRKHYVALSGLFVSQYFYGDRKSFRAILLHELAHIHNGDVYKTYITISLWLAFVATALAPAAAIFLWRLTTLRWWEAAPLLLNGILWTGIVVLSGLAVLRSREYYADVQASIWDQRSQIDRVLAALPVPAGKPWRYCLRVHPDPRERRQIVDDPSRLLRLSFADAFGIGIAAWLVVGVVTGILYPFMPSHPWAAIAFTGSVIFGVPAFVFILAIGALGIDVWRSAFASLLKGDPASEGTGWLAVAFVAGAFPALALSLTEAVLLSLGEQSTRVGFAPGLFLVKAMTYCALLAGCLLIFRWISQTTSAWFEVVLQCRSPKWVLLSSVVAALVLVVITLFVGLSAAMRIALGVRDSGLSGIGSTWTIPILIVSLIAWVFPLAATWWRKPMASPESAGWVFLDRASPKIPGQEPVYPSQALSIGFALGLIHLLLWQLLHLSKYFPAEIAHEVHFAFRWLWAWTESVFGERRFLHWGSAAGLQALAAAIAAARARRLSVASGLSAASVAGFVIAMGDHVSSPNSYGFPAWVNAVTAIATMGEGAVVALPTAIIVAWLANVGRRLCASKLVSRKVAAKPRESRRAMRWSALSKWSFVTLFIVAGFGLIVRMSEVREVNAYRAAGERGDSDAQNKLGDVYAQGLLAVARNDAHAVRWWRKAAERGHADAQYNLALMLLSGRGAQRDEIMAVQWIRRAAEQGHANAQNELGISYGLGRGTPRDDAAAAEWFRKAAEQGQADAQHNLGLMQRAGRALAR